MNSYLIQYESVYNGSFGDVLPLRSKGFLIHWTPVILAARLLRSKLHDNSWFLDPLGLPQGPQLGPLGFRSVMVGLSTWGTSVVNKCVRVCALQVCVDWPSLLSFR